MTDGVMSRRALPAVAGHMLESLFAHRLLTGRQLHELHAPHAGQRWTRRVIAQLVDRDLVAFERAGRGGRRVFYLTSDGAQALGHRPGRSDVERARHAAGAFSHHTLAVNDVGIAFVRAARLRGDECGQLAWRHEVAHPVGTAPGGRRELLIADGLLTYLQHTAAGELVFHYRFIELDRATQPTEALAAKLARYAHLHRYTTNNSKEPQWRTSYPVFPDVLCVLTGAPRPALGRRARTVLALCHANPTLQATPEVSVALCLLEDLIAQGPWAAIFRRPQQLGQLVTWTGEPA